LRQKKNKLISQEREKDQKHGKIFSAEALLKNLSKQHLGPQDQKHLGL
jgi:hypothetical protein